ncbi:MAG: PEP-CTERM sorting domain-containing protein [Proteobacteria bacterium]|nr:MAG: PEP-CTERM sorting domain-containing protein [Pseudomonadota bacterium]
MASEITAIMNQKIVCKIIGVFVVAGFVTAAHAQGKGAIDVSGVTTNSNNTTAPGFAPSVGISGATNSVPGEPGSIVSIPEPGTALLALAGGASLLGLAIIRRRK